jgi:hypothetical protein
MVTYGFHAESGGILATLTLSGDGPYYHTDVVEMTFTAEGNSIFNFGVGTYDGLFDDTWNAPAVPVGSGLGTGDFPTSGPSTFFDADPPLTSDGFIPEFLAVRFRNRSWADEIEYIGPSGTRVGSDGDWITPLHSVPLPATILLLGTVLIGLLGFRRKFRK